MKRLWILLLLSVTVAPPQSRSSVPRNISLAGRLIEADGTPIRGMHAVSVALYAQQNDRVPLYEQTRIVTASESGSYSVNITPPNAQAGAWAELLPAVGVAPPRVKIASVPYALRAHDADNLGGQPASAYAHTSDLQHLQATAQQYTDAAATTVLSAVNAEQLRARQFESTVEQQLAAEVARAQAAEAASAQAFSPQAGWIITTSSTPPEHYLFTGLVLQSAGIPTPEAQLLLGANSNATAYTLYLHLRAN